MRNTKRISASNFFYGVAAILLVVQLALILWILKYQFVLTIYDGIPGTIAVVVSTVIPAFFGRVLSIWSYQVAGLETKPLRSDPSECPWCSCNGCGSADYRGRTGFAQLLFHSLCSGIY